MGICKLNKTIFPISAWGRKNDERKGFTLFEVMVALTIIAIAFTSVFKLHGQTISMSHSSRFYTTAPLLCQKKLAEIERGDISKEMDESGDFGEQYQGFSWHVTVAPVESEALEDSFKLAKIDVTVSQGTAGMTHQVRAYRYIEENEQ